MYDLIIRNGMVVDGTRAPAYQADVCIQNGRIAAWLYRHSHPLGSRPVVSV